MKKLLTICIAIFSLSIYAQQKNTAISNYQLSSSDNGPTNTTVKLKYWVSNSFGSLFLHLESECLPNLSYQYNGRVWTTEGIANAALNIKARNPIVFIAINGPNNFQKVLKVFLYNSGSQIDLGMASKDEKKVPENYTVSIQKIDNVSFDNVREVEEIIRSKLLLAEKDLKINQLLKDGDNAFDRKELMNAESKYRELLKLDSSNERAVMRLKQIQHLQKTESSKKQFDEAIAAAKLEESQENFDEAKSLYESALATGIDNSAASNGVNRVQRKMQEKINSALEKAKAIEEKSNQEKLQKNNVAKQASEKTKTEAAAKDKELREIAENAQKAKLDSLAATLRMEEREKFKKELAQKFEEKRNRERIAANERDRKLDERSSKRRSEDAQRIERIEQEMNYDPELYADKLEKAMERFDFAASIKPYSVLKMEKEWWDNNPYIQVFADELYEPQRLERQATSRQLLNQKINAYDDAKNLFLYAMENVDKDSKEQLFLLDKIDDCNVSLDIYDVSATYGDQFEKERIQAREDARILEQTNRFLDHRDRARAAYLVLERDPMQPAKYLVATYELAQRMDVAQKNYEENMMVVGASQSIVTSVIQDSSKNSILNSVSYLFNFYASAGTIGLPIILNVTGDNIDSQSLVSETSFLTANVGKDFWWFKSKFFDVGTAAYFGYGSNSPKKGVESYFLHYSGRLNMNFGYKKLKLATVTEFVGRSGKVEEDFDVINAGQLGLGATNRFDKSSFNYTVLRFGAGLRYEMSNAVGDEYNFLQLTAYAEKPSFYPFAITEKPIITYELELLLFGGLKFEFSYANNYVVAGTADYSFTKIVDKNFYRASIGKVWNIL